MSEQSEQDEIYDFDPLEIKTETDLWAHLSKPPDPRHIRETQSGWDKQGNPIMTKYLPISYVEAKLRQFFGPLGYQFKNGRNRIVINETVGEIEVWVRNPLDRSEWLVYEGWAATQIQLKKGAQVLDVASKIKNSQEKMHPSLKSRCVSNAVKALGPAFGANIGRKEDQTETITKEIAVEEINKYKAMLEFAEDKKELEAAKDLIPHSFHDLKPIREAVILAENRLSQKTLPQQAGAQTLFE